MEEHHRYDNEFFDYVERGAYRSALNVVPLVSKGLWAQSVLDVGCGRGIWLREWARAGVTDCLGVDGHYIDQTKLAIPKAHFVARDLSQPFDLGRKFDIVQSLEVAEHISDHFAEVFMDNLCRHSSVILFSAAVPGQGGEMHVNERPLEYWREKFLDRGYAAFDWIRPMISDNVAVEPWYRYNSLLFANDDAVSRLPAEIKTTRIPAGERIANFAPIGWRTRNMVLRCLPPSIVNWLAIFKHKISNLRAKASLFRK